MKLAKVGILIDEKAAKRRWEFGVNVFEQFLGEILAHRGISFQWLTDVNQIKACQLDVLLIGLMEEHTGTASIVWEFAELGGTVISYAGLNSLAERFGYMLGRPADKGYAHLQSDLFEESRPLRFLQAAPWIQKLNSLREEEGAKNNPSVYQVQETKTIEPIREIGRIVKDHPNGQHAGDALQQFSVGKGFIDRWSINIPYTVVGLMQGTKPVFEDGYPAPDGTGPVNDGVLKADDQAEMDWDLDRVKTETGVPYFAHPYADLWREILISHLLQRVVGQDMTLPFTGYWPNGIDHVALISLDSDHTGDTEAESTYQLLRECEIPATWCMMEKEYSRPMYERILQAGDELGLHYNAVPVDQGRWGADEFERQANWFRATTGLKHISSNKNHLTRVEGWGELFRWCEANGVASDQTRGNSKKGNVGFLFGTCHPYFPMAWSDEQNRLYDVLEISFLYGDFLSLDTSLIAPFLEQAKRVEGVAHFCFHPIHIHNKEFIRDWLRSIVRQARPQGFVFWTGKQINDWERARRKLQILKIDQEGNPMIEGLMECENVVVWIPLTESEQAHYSHVSERRHGVLCRKAVL
ncbi:hypothetical protein SAMN04487897_10639 [Paenibacillus sp. yr247]|uniref:hypothetical protein n=1 Tax=Paenibacillus sp. yr247 TaxID=1761880 RepID=UPI0008865C38|nr:hypothetical protein [Paenibacillus sp. yr247]SDN93218.1 hypothetical protein SAMN04487897_10639 [Paenibacillus sp. yr247]